MPLSPDTIHLPSENVHWDFEDQVVIVTGASHGQGASHAQSFAEAGANLVISDIGAEMKYFDYPLGTIDELDKVATSIESIGRRCLSTVCDVRDPEQVKQLVDRAIAEFGRIDVLLCNAGVATVGHLVDLPQDQWEDTIDTDLSGVFYCCKYVAPHMIEANYGRIVVTGSTQSMGGMKGAAHYTAAKHGAYGLVKGFAQELDAYDVTVNLVCPTAVDTAIASLFGNPKYVELAEEATAMIGSWNLFQEEMMHEREITEGMLWLASRDAGAISGTALMIDGGCMCK